MTGAPAPLASLEHRHFKAGETILHQGDAGNCAYIVVSGRVEIWRETEGNRKRLGIVGDGAVFGEMALIDDQPRMASATALTETVCAVVPEHVIKQKLQQADPFLNALLRIFVASVRSLER